MFARDKRIGPYTYIYLVENVRENGRTKQRIIANLARQTVEIAPRDDHLPAPKIGDDALFGAAILPHVLDQVDIGVGADALVAGEHTVSILKSPIGSTNLWLDKEEFSTAILPRFHQPSAFPPFPTAKTGPAVQVGSDSPLF